LADLPTTLVDQSSEHTMSQTTKATPPSAPAESSNRVTLGLSNRLLARP
jgi:hypothetical protein